MPGPGLHDGGARYNTNYIQGVGIAALTDSFSAIKQHVFDEKTFTMTELLTAMKDNFAGHERLRQMVLNKTPRYGNDDDRADGIMRELFDAYYQEVNGRPRCAAGPIASTCCPPPATSISAR